jgi:hypothetical protein
MTVVRRALLSDGQNTNEAWMAVGIAEERVDLEHEVAQSVADPPRLTAE